MSVAITPNIAPSLEEQNRLIDEAWDTFLATKVWDDLSGNWVVRQPGPVGRVVHVNDRAPGAVYIGRAMPIQHLSESTWANPHRIVNKKTGAFDLTPRQSAILAYKRDLLWGNKRHLLASLPELRGKPLACWCRHDGQKQTDETWCHGDILLDCLATWSDEQLRLIGGAE